MWPLKLFSGHFFKWFFSESLFKWLFLILVPNPVIAQVDLDDLYSKGNFEYVIRKASEEMATGDTLYNTFYFKALSEVHLGRTEQAIRTLMLSSRYYPADLTIRRILASQLFEAGDYQNARQCYLDLVNSDQNNEADWLKLAEIANFRQEYAEATYMLKQLLDLDSTNLSGLIMLGDLLYRQNDSTAVVYYKRAWDIYPDNQKVTYSLANLYIQSNMPEMAIPVCERILETDSTNIRFRKLLGFANYKSGFPRPSITQFKIAVSLGDSTSFTFKFLGISQYLAIEFEEAISSFHFAAKKDSMDAEIQFFLGASLANTKRKTEAMKHLDRSLELMKPDPVVISRIYSEQGNIMRLENRYEDAYALYEKAWLSDTTDPMALYYMASILDNSLHRSKEALADYQKYIASLELLQDSDKRNQQGLSIRAIVEDRIVSLKEELFFFDEK